MNRAAAVGIDVGGTSIKGVRVAADGTVLERSRAATPAPDPGGRRVAEVVAQVLARLGVPADVPVGVVVPGVVDEARGVVRRSVTLDWTDLAYRALLEERLGRAVAFGHDVRSGGLAEARTGAARGVRGVVAFVAVGTGLAAAVLVDGRPLASDGWAGEIGQLVLDGGPCSGRRVEEVASAGAVARHAGTVDAQEASLRAAAGDPVAAAVWDEAVRALAGAVAGLVVAVAPTTVVVGGGLALAGERLLGPLRVALHERLPGLRVPDLRAARHGDDAAALGAAMLALDADATAASPATADVP